MQYFLIFSQKHRNFQNLTKYLSIDAIKQLFIPLNIDNVDIHHFIASSPNISIDRFPSVLMVNHETGDISKYDGIEQTLSFMNSLYENYINQQSSSNNMQQPPSNNMQQQPPSNNMQQQPPSNNMQQQPPSNNMQQQPPSNNTPISDIFGDTNLSTSEKLKKERELQDEEFKRSFSKTSTMSTGPI